MWFFAQPFPLKNLRKQNTNPKSEVYFDKFKDLVVIESIKPKRIISSSLIRNSANVMCSNLSVLNSPHYITLNYMYLWRATERQSQRIKESVSLNEEIVKRIAARKVVSTPKRNKQNCFCWNKNEPNKNTKTNATKFSPRLSRTLSDSKTEYFQTSTVSVQTNNILFRMKTKSANSNGVFFLSIWPFVASSYFPFFYIFFILIHTFKCWFFFRLVAPLFLWFYFIILYMFFYFKCNKKNWTRNEWKRKQCIFILMFTCTCIVH